MATYFNQSKADLIHIPHFNVPLLINNPFVVTIHDILWHHIKGPSVTTLSPLMYKMKYLGYRAVMRLAASHARHIFVPSRFVKNELLQAYPALNPSKITVTYEGVDLNLPHFPHRRHLPPYVLYVGSLYPHKNITVMLEALSGLLSAFPEVRLKVVSSRNIFTDTFKRKVAEMSLSANVDYLGFIPDRQLAKLYSQAMATVVPSLSEGFGLTGLEAMHQGSPVVAARAGALPEIYGESALYFDPYKPQSLAAQLVALFKSASLRDSLRQSGRSRVSRYSWDATIPCLLQTYQGITSS
jgi:glycosyltransferase involved in cell wall biosynthesis